MNRMNDIVRRCLNQAIAGLHLLDEAGATVVRVDLASRNPIIWVDGPPPGVIGTRALLRVQFERGKRRAVYVTKVGDCQVQWRAIHPAPATQATG